MSQTFEPLFQPSKIGLGCMNLSHAYGTPLSEPEALNALRKAFDLAIATLTRQRSTEKARTSA
ncbi:hypothetical protein [Nitrincola nitratireducens]|uniref:Aldo/keto reductase family protein n=1 Tax=Nitrincola nitratireducens TaxID=1229521 RepID=W9UZL0_9GAMM|nr:hypothetical protein D791_02920 [Nitrincola nitratireducens]